MPARTVILALAATLAAGGLALYGSGLAGGNVVVSADPCAGAGPAMTRIDAAARGEVAAMRALPRPKPAPDLAFKGPDGAGIRLADLRGRLLLVNLWATWCAPCKAEMPALDRLEREAGGADFAVVAINVDTRNAERAPAWLRENGIDRLAFYSDPGGRVLPAVQRDTGSPGLPTTMLIDAAGCTLGVMRGPAAWASEDGLALIRAALGRT